MQSSKENSITRTQWALLGAGLASLAYGLNQINSNHMLNSIASIRKIKK